MILTNRMTCFRYNFIKNRSPGYKGGFGFLVKVQVMGEKVQVMEQKPQVKGSKEGILKSTHNKKHRYR